MTDQPLPDEPVSDESFNPADPDYDVSGFMQQLNDAVAEAGGEAVTGDGDDDPPAVTVLEMPKDALFNLLRNLGLTLLDDVDLQPDDTPWETLVEGQLRDSQDFLSTVPHVTVVTWLIGDYNLQWVRRKDAQSKQERAQYTETMCLHLSRIVVVARFLNKKYRPDYSHTSRGHKKTVDLLLNSVAKHHWDTMGDLAAQRLYTLMGGER